MTDDVTQGQTPAAPEAGNEEQADAKKTFDETYVKELRSESASYRTKLRDAEKRLADLEAAAKQGEESKLAEEQKWQQLAEKRAQELEKLSQQLKAMEVNVRRVKVA